MVRAVGDGRHPPRTGAEYGRVLSFACYGRDRQPERLHMDTAYAVGADGVPVRADITASDGCIRVVPRGSEPVGLALLWPVADAGKILVETTRLPLRPETYNLHVELARQRLMRISLKREEWGLFDYPGIEEMSAAIDSARDVFVAALQHADEPMTAAKLADQSLSLSVAASERLARFHASVFLSRRQQSNGFARRYLGVGVANVQPTPALTQLVGEHCDFVRIPFVWRDIQPKEQGVTYAHADAWMKACAAAKLPVRAGPVLNLGVRSVPDWMYLWENDFDTIADMAREHVRRTVKRYGSAVTSWDVVTGLHAGSVFDLSIEQIMDLTRLAAATTKQLAPRAQVILEIVQPWGEYYARNQRTIPPLLYAEMAVQSGIPFDAFGLQLLCGSNGYHVRDLFQVSALIDRLANLGKPIHVSALACPSIDPGVSGKPDEGGRWHGPWNEATQAQWLDAMLEVALSKPYVDTVCLRDLVDYADATIPGAAVLRADLCPKPALNSIIELRRRLRR